MIDDASTDGSGDVALSYADPRVRLIRNEETLGLTRSLNIGLAAARGELIARQDADDVSHPRRLTRQLRLLEQHRDVVLVGSRYRETRPRLPPAAA